VSGRFAAADISVACGQTQNPKTKLGYYGISWDFVEVNGYHCFLMGKANSFNNLIPFFNNIM
jgi:hypothetical protein